jgi:hypothetical protein
MKILIGNYIANITREDIFKSIIGNESLHEASNDNGVRVVNFATSRNLIFKSTTFPHRNINKHTWTSPDGVTHNQIDRNLIGKNDIQIYLMSELLEELSVVMTTSW